MDFDGVSTLLPVRLHDHPEARGRLLRATQSVLTQSCPLPMELLLIDDGSAPPLRDHPDLASLLASPNVTCLRLARNHGLVFALNAGLNRARYRLIARIDADDFWRPGKLAKQLQAFASDPDLSLLGTAMRLVHQDPALDSDHRRGSTWQDALDFFASTGCPFPHGSILARRDIFELLGGYPHTPAYHACEDFALWGTWVRFFKCGMLDEVLFEYSVSEAQQSARYAEQQRDATRLVRENFLGLGNHRRIPGAVQEIARALGRPLLETGRILFVAWHYYDHILADAALLDPLRALLPDRAIHPYAGAVNLSADRFFYLHPDADFDRKLAAHARCVHDRSSIAPLLA